MKRPVERVLEETLRAIENEYKRDLLKARPSSSAFFEKQSSIQRLEPIRGSLSLRLPGSLVKFLMNLAEFFQTAWYRVLFGKPARRTTVAVGRTYRKGKAQITWHFCLNCSTWPTSNYEERRKPKGELCNECQHKFKSGRCRILSIESG